MVGLAGLALGGGGLVAFVQAKAVNRKTNAEADVTLGGGWQLLWQSQRTEINELRERIVVVEKSDEECKQRLARYEGVASSTAIERTVVAVLDKEIAKRGGLAVDGTPHG